MTMWQACKQLTAVARHSARSGEAAGSAVGHCWANVTAGTTVVGICREVRGDARLSRPATRPLLTSTVNAAILVGTVARVPTTCEQISSRQGVYIRVVADQAWTLKQPVTKGMAIYLEGHAGDSWQHIVRRPLPLEPYRVRQDHAHLHGIRVQVLCIDTHHCCLSTTLQGLVCVTKPCRSARHNVRHYLHTRQGHSKHQRQVTQRNSDAAHLGLFACGPGTELDMLTSFASTTQASLLSRDAFQCLEYVPRQSSA